MTAPTLHPCEPWLLDSRGASNPWHHTVAREAVADPRKRHALDLQLLRHRAIQGPTPYRGDNPSTAELMALSENATDRECHRLRFP